MRVDARWEHRVVVDAKLCVLAEICVLVTRSPVMEYPPTGRALKGLDLVFDIEIDACIEHLGDQSIVITRNMVERIKCAIGADEEWVSEGLFRSYSLARVKCEELPDEVE